MLSSNRLYRVSLSLSFTLHPHLFSQSFCRFSCHSTQPNSTRVSWSEASWVRLSQPKSQLHLNFAHVCRRGGWTAAKENYANWKSTDADVRICGSVTGNWQLKLGAELGAELGGKKGKLQSDAIRERANPRENPSFGWQWNWIYCKGESASDFSAPFTANWVKYLWWVAKYCSLKRPFAPF